MSHERTNSTQEPYLTKERPTGEKAASIVEVADGGEDVAGAAACRSYAPRLLRCRQSGGGEDVAGAAAARLQLMFSAAANPLLVFVAYLGFFF